MGIITDSPLLYISIFVLTVAEHWLETLYVDKRGKLDNREERVVHVIVKPYVHQSYHHAMLKFNTILATHVMIIMSFLCSGSDNYALLFSLQW